MIPFYQGETIQDVVDNMFNRIVKNMNIKENKMRENVKTFRVGDKVKSLDDGYSVFGEDGTITDIKKVNKKVVYWVKFLSEDSPLAHFENELSLVEPTYKWESKFNIGDKVIYEKGVYEICAVAKDNHDVWYRFVEELDLNDIWHQEWGIELYVEPKIDEMTMQEICKELGRDIKIKK